MALTLQEIEAERARARFHLQVQLLQIPLAVEKPQKVWLSARVVSVFKGADAIGRDDEIELCLPLCAAGGQVPPGEAYIELDSLAGARLIDVFANGEPPRLTCAASGVSSAASGSDTPASKLSPSDPAPARSSPWWKLWR